MGCVSSVQVSPGSPGRDSSTDSPTREAGSTPVFDKDTTASGKYSTRRGLTVWDLQAEKERKLKVRCRQAITPLSEHSFKRSASASDRLFVVVPEEVHYGSVREYPTGPVSAVRPKQSTIPPWNINHRPLSRASSPRYSNAMVVNSPSSRSIQAQRSGIYVPPSPSSAGSSYNYHPASPAHSRSSKLNNGVNLSNNIRSSKSLSSFSDMSTRNSRYGDRSSPELYPARRVR